MSIFIGKSLYDGQLPTVKTTLYTVPVAKTAYIRSLTLFNTSATPQTTIIYINIGGTSRVWKRYTFLQNESAEVFEDGYAILLPANSSIEGLTTTASAVDMVLTGIEET